jgi:hypothetical protein
MGGHQNHSMNTQPSSTSLMQTMSWDALSITGELCSKADFTIIRLIEWPVRYTRPFLFRDVDIPSSWHHARLVTSYHTRASISGLQLFWTRGFTIPGIFMKWSHWPEFKGAKWEKDEDLLYHKADVACHYMGAVSSQEGLGVLNGPGEDCRRLVKKGIPTSPEV